MMEFPTYEELGKRAAKQALDNFLINGKPLREWITVLSGQDAISRAKVIDMIKETAKYHTGDSFNADRLIRYIKELPPLVPKTYEEWHYCAQMEDLPEEQDEYLVTWTGYIGNKITKPFIAILEYSDEWLTEPIEKMGYNNVMVQAWMELPKAYGVKESGL